MSGRRAALAVAALGALLYLPSLRGGFVWDDTALAGDAEHMRAYGWLQPLWDNSWHAVETARFYRPMMFWSHRVDLAVWGEAPAGHHATNVLLFAGLVVTLMTLLRQLGMTRASWTLAAVAFVTHPSHVEVVSWVAGRPDLLAALFALLYVVGVLRRWPLPATFLCMLGALLSKEVAVAVPLALFGAALGRRDDRAWRDVTPRAVVAPFALAFGVYAAARLACPGLARGYPYGAPRSAAELALVTLTNVKLAGRYLAMLLTGMDFGPLAFSEMITLRKLAGGDVWAHLAREVDGELALGACALAGLGVAAARAAWRDRTMRFAVLLGVLSLVLSMNLTSARHQIAFGDRYLFVPTIAAAIALARAGPLPRGAVMVAALACSLWAGVVVTRTERYADGLAFWRRAVELNPGSVHAHHMLGAELARAGRRQDALAELSIALSLDPLPETRALRDALRPGSGTPNPAPTP